MKAWTLGSGSRGNAIVLESGDTRVLVDSGFAPRVLARRLAVIGMRPESIAAVVVTHEHVDHVRGVRAAQRRWHWPVFGAPGTIAGIRGLDASRTTVVAVGGRWEIGAFQFELIRVPHDAASPTAVLATATQSGYRTGLAHDLGAPTEELARAFRDLDLLLVESNHDSGMLRSGPYPPFLQDRVAGRNGHLSNAQSSALQRALAGPALREIVLLHLSEVNNSPAIALAAAAAAQRAAARRCPVSAAGQDVVAGPFGDTCGSGRGSARRTASQLSLAL